MKSSTPKITRATQLDRMLQVALRAPLSLSQHLQPHALLPTGNSVPLSSEAYYAWISSALAAKGIRPCASQLGHLIRQLNAEAMLTLREETINLRIAHPSPGTYTLDLANASSEVINISADGWKVTTDFDTRFHRPDNVIFFQPPVKVRTKLHHALKEIFQLDETQSEQLSTWLVDALLTRHIPPTLIITGKCRHEAAAKIRNFADPMMSPVHGIPSSSKALGRLAINNRVMAFGMYKTITSTKIEQLNELRTGMLVELKQVTKNSDLLTELIRRPIILAAEAAPQIHEGQIEIEINHIALVESSDILAALLDAAVSQIRELQEHQARQVHLERAAPDTQISPLTTEGEPEGPAP